MKPNETEREKRKLKSEPVRNGKFNIIKIERPDLTFAVFISTKKAN